MSQVTQIQHQIITPLEAALIISENDTTTRAIDLFGSTAVMLEVPGDLSGSSLSFLGSTDGSTYRAIKDSNNQPISIDIDTSGGLYPLQPSVFVGIRLMKIVCDSAQSVDTSFFVVPALV